MHTLERMRRTPLVSALAMAIAGIGSGCGARAVRGGAEMPLPAPPPVATLRELGPREARTLSTSLFTVLNDGGAARTMGTSTAYDLMRGRALTIAPDVGRNR